MIRIGRTSRDAYKVNRMSKERIATTRQWQAMWLLAALSTLPLCSCRAPAHVAAPIPTADSLPAAPPLPEQTAPAQPAYDAPPPLPPQQGYRPLPVPFSAPVSQQHLQAAYNAPPLPASAYHGVSYEAIPCRHHGCRGCQGCVGQRHRHGAPLPAPGRDLSWDGPDCIRMPDEYICDGGDREVEVSVLADWTVRGLDTEDTIAHYDTLQGDTVIETANRVCIYAPRFAAVRSVRGISGHQQMENPIAARDRQLPHQEETDLFATTSIQHQQPLGKFGLKPVNMYEARDIGIPLQRTYVAAGLAQDYLAHEDFKLIRHGLVDLAEKARLANMVDNAIAWTGDEAVKVAIDGKLPVEASNNVTAEQLYVYDFGESRMRIVKTASKQNARPGEIIDFTLRFDNVGDQTIGNVTVIDSLTTRLEFVEGSVQSSVATDFFTQENEGDSLVLRFEVVDPVPVGKGGVIRFQARVR